LHHFVLGNRGRRAFIPHLGCGWRRNDQRDGKARPMVSNCGRKPWRSGWHAVSVLLMRRGEVTAPPYVHGASGAIPLGQLIMRGLRQDNNDVPGISA
jgi:hypothetical protein